jgi:penicillin-binding protein 1A
MVRLAMFGSLAATVAGAGVIAYYSHLAKQYDLTGLGQMPERTIVLDARGELMGRMHGENRIVVPISEVSPQFIEALLAREDARFYQHGGIDYRGVARAFVRNIKDGRIVQGASTITMQLARNSFVDLNDRTIHRKLVEMMLARRIEKACTKDQILEHYVNRIFFGTGLYGIQRASQVYFGKHASQLTLSEGAMIAGIIRSPVRFSPFRNLQGAVKERDDVLQRMLQTKVITAEEELDARYADVVLRAQPAFPSQGGYSLDAVKRDLDLILEEQDILDGGLTVVTTFRQDLQEFTQAVLEKRLAEVEKRSGYSHTRKAEFDRSWDPTTELSSTPYLQGAVALIDNTTGGVLALVGGREYRHSRYNRASQGFRQIGSTVKPFVYAAGITSGLLPGTIIEDSAIQYGEIRGADPGWSPRNSDGKFKGPMQLAEGLVQSRNTVTLRVGNYATVGGVQELLRNAGIGDHAEDTPQIFIGNLGGNPRELASAFSIFPNQGVRRRTYVIDRILDANGRVLYQTPVLEAEVITPGTAHVMRRMLSEVIDRGTGASLRSEHDFKAAGGGKTGTTNDYKDAWFSGYTDRLTCAVWVGLDRPKTIAKGAYGGTVALPIYADVMKAAIERGFETDVPRVQVPMSKVQLCRVSSQLATQGCSLAGSSYEDELPYELIPQAFCSVHQGYATRPAYGQAQGQSGDQPGFWDRFRGWFRRR